MKFKKIATVLGSALMVGSTLGLAAAAAYPAPFVSNGAANVAIVVGTAGAEASDMVAATDISADLAKDLSAQSVGGVKTVTGGDSFKLEKSSDKFNYGNALSAVYPSLDKDELKTFLADGNYKDGDVDTDYTQTVTLGDKAMALFADKDFKNDAPTVGWMFGKDDKVLSYKIDFDTAVLYSEINGTNMPLLGKEYYVLSNSAKKVTLLDSANKKVLADGEKMTVNDKEVSIEWIDSSDVKLNINGEITNKLSVGDSEQLDDGSYVVVTDVMASSRESTVQKVEFSLGKGKIILEDGKEVIVGEDSDDKVDGLYAAIVENSGTTGIDSITLNWTALSDETFLAEGSPIVMPGLGVLGLSFDGLKYPSTSEKISIENGETLTLMMDNFDLPLMWYNGNVIQQGEEDYKLVIANATYTYANAGYTNNTTMWFNDINITNVSTVLSNGLALQEDNRFIATSIDNDLADVETLYYEVSELTVDNDGTFTVTLKDMVGNNDITFDEDTMTEDVSDLTLTLKGFNAANTTAYINFASSNGNMVYNKAVSKTGMVVTIPALNATGITFQEANEDGDVATDGTILDAVNVKISDNDKLYVQYNGSKEEVSNDKFVAIVDSKLASKISVDESGDEYDFSIEYFGEEVTADVLVTAGGVVSESDSSLGTITVLDNEADKMTGKNLIVVGGNCVNSVAASLLGLTAGASCMADFSAKTGVANGGYLIQSFDKAGKVALLVAGYSAADTTKAKTYLVNNNVETVVGTKLKGTSATEATVVTA